MDIEENLFTARLIDVYGKLLTSKQYEIITSYYFDNLSLAEIGENYNISRQAVKDAISKSIKLLNDYEETLGFCEKADRIANDLADIIGIGVSDDVQKKLNGIIEYVRS